MEPETEQSNDLTSITTTCGHEYLACPTVVEHQRTPCPHTYDKAIYHFIYKDADRLCHCR
jgi:hypothetical protein